jgi:predicted acyl esterase
MKPTILIAALLSLGIAGSSLPVSAIAQTTAASSIADAQRQRADYIRSHYSKFEYQIAMRDGKKLFTAVYVPLDAGPAKTYPVLMVRTPYSIAPYGAANYKPMLAPTADYEKDGYIFVFQDVRGTYMSEGEFVNMRPHISQKNCAGCR